MDHEEQRKQIAQRLKKARERKGFTQERVEKATGVNRTTLGGYENRVSEPNLITLSRLAACYEVSTDWIINGLEYTTDPIKKEEQK